MKKTLIGFLAMAAGGCAGNDVVSVPSSIPIPVNVPCHASIGEPIDVPDAMCGYGHMTGGYTVIEIDRPDLYAKWTMIPGERPSPYMFFSLEVVTPTWSCSRWTADSWATFAYNEETRLSSSTAYAACVDGNPAHVISAAFTIDFTK